MDDDNYPLYLRDMAKILRNGFSKSDPGVLIKYLWIHDQYIKAIAQFEGLSPKHNYRVNNPENYEAVVSLPKLTTEVRRARRIIAQAKRKENSGKYGSHARQIHRTESTALSS